MNTDERIAIGVSSCLLGNRVRYDGGHKYDAHVIALAGHHFDLRAFCPEAGAGLGVPRPAIRLVAGPAGVRALGVADPGRDVTDRLAAFGDAQVAGLATLSGFILKSGSPSCGMAGVRVYDSRGAVTGHSAGVFAAGIRARCPQLPVVEAESLGAAPARENFIQRVVVYHRWRAALAKGLDAQALAGFHAAVRWLLMSRDPDASSRLGALVASVRGENLPAVAAQYIAGVMATLATIATRDGHARVLCRIAAALGPLARAELAPVIHRYREGEIPLLTPLNAVKRHLDRERAPDIELDWYLSPYP
ncbi:MAG: DUF523 and DUF1722 domain-containing protein [Porticoccaceae bacterium]